MLRKTTLWSCMFVLVLAALLLQVAHSFHDGFDHDCSLCHVGSYSIGTTVKSDFSLDFKASQNLEPWCVDFQKMRLFQSKGSRGPPA